MRARLFTFIFVFTSVFFMLNGQSAHALSCVEPGSPQEELALNDGAIYGKVKQIKVDLKQEGFTGTKEAIRYILVDVERSWKTQVDSQVIIATNFTWGYDFKEGSKYVIYFSNVDGELNSSPCSATIEMNNLNQATELFGDGFAPQEQVNVEHKMWFMFEHDIDFLIVIAVVLIVTTVFFFFIIRARRNRT